MTIYDLLVPTFTQVLSGLSRQLAVATENAKSPEDFEARFLSARLAPDMKVLGDQVGYVRAMMLSAVEKLTGNTVAISDQTNMTLESASASIDDVANFIRSLTSADFEGAESKQIHFVIGNGTQFELNGFEYVRDWVLPQLYFHATTAYAILRHEGVPLQKLDFVSHVAKYALPLKDERR